MPSGLAPAGEERNDTASALSATKLVDLAIGSHWKRLRVTPATVDDVLLTPKGDLAPEPRPGRVIVAEDDAEMRSLLVEALERDGFEVVSVPDGRKLLERLAVAHRIGDSVDVVITDVRMPGVTGLEALEQLRHASCCEPVIVVTAFGDARTHLQAELLGAWAVLDKPFELDELRALVRELWRNHSRTIRTDRSREQSGAFASARDHVM